MYETSSNLKFSSQLKSLFTPSKNKYLFKSSKYTYCIKNFRIKTTTE